MAINWEQAEKDAGNNYSPIAEVGNYKAKVDSIDLRETKNSQGETTYWMDFLFVDDGTRYPKISHPISRKNINWCAWHFMNILKELGISEDKAKTAISQAEDKKSLNDVMAAYRAMFERAVAKNPEVEIEVYEDSNINPNNGRPYMRADFKNPRIGFGRRDTAKKVETVSADSIMDDGEQISLEELPF